MISPVTSTSVATKGAEEEAGSAPNFFNMIGSILPASVPQSTTPTSEKLTDKTNRIPMWSINILKYATDH